MRRARNNFSVPTITNSQAVYVFASVAAGVLIFILGRASVAVNGRAPAQELTSWTASLKDADTLVVYAYANRDWEYPRNIAFFVRHGAALPLTI